METGKISRKRHSFTMVANQAMRDKSISLKAKGLYSVMQSYLDMSSIGFVVYKSYLQNNVCADGRDSFNSAWKELEKAGYLLVEKKRTTKGTYAYEYTLLDEPIDTSQPHTENPSLDKPSLDDLHTDIPTADESVLEQPSSADPSVNQEASNQTLEKNTEHMYFSAITPEDFLISRQNGVPLSRQDKSILRALAKYGFPNEVQVSLLKYVLEVSQNRLIRSFVEMVAGEWARDGVRTLADAEREKTKTLGHGRRAEVLPAYYHEQEQNQTTPTDEPPADEEHHQTREEMMAWFEKMKADAQGGK